MSGQVSGRSMAWPQARPEWPVFGGTGWKMREEKGCEAPSGSQGLPVRPEVTM